MLEKFLKRKDIQNIFGEYIPTEYQTTILKKLLTKDFKYTEMKQACRMIMNGILIDNVEIHLYELRKLGKDRSSLNYLKLLYPEKIAKEKFYEFKNKSKHTEQKFIEKYGEIIGKEKWIQHKKKCVPSKENFIKKYGDTNKFDEYLENKKTSKKNMYSLEWFEKKYGDEGKIKFEERNSNFKKENYVDVHGIEKFNKKMSNAASARSISVYIEKYGVEEGTKKYNTIQLKKANSLKKFIEKYGEKEGIEKFESYINKLKIAVSEEGYVKKYGEKEGIKKWKEFIDKSKHTLEKYIKTYGDELGKKKYEKLVEKRTKALRYDSYIEKYGEEEGKRIWFEILERRTSIGKYSKISKQFFDMFIEYNSLEKSDCLYGDNEKCIVLCEQEMLYLKKFAIYPDFIYGNKIIEFNGNYWHDKNSEADKKRTEILKTKGFEVFTVWEDDFKKDMNECIQKISNDVFK